MKHFVVLATDEAIGYFTKYKGRRMRGLRT
jgi:hypothetical protein